MQALLAAVEQYEQAALAHLAPLPVDVGQLNPAQLLAYREADPAYRLGYVRGHQRGVSQGQRAAEPALQLYARHAALPAPTSSPIGDQVDLVQRVRLLLAFHQSPAPVSAARLDTLRSQLAPATYSPFPTAR